MSTDLGHRTEQQPATRSDLARQLLARVDRLAPRLNNVSLAAEVQLLKRELARGHPVLSARPEDNNFLSVVTLVEAALASLTWKGYTPGVLDALRQAFSAGLREGEFTFEEYDAIMLDPDPRTRPSSSDVVEQIARDYDAFLACWEGVPEQPYLVAFMPFESRETVYKWGWIAHDPATQDGREELAQFLVEDIRGAASSIRQAVQRTSLEPASQKNSDGRSSCCWGGERRGSAFRFRARSSGSQGRSFANCC